MNVIMIPEYGKFLLLPPLVKYLGALVVVENMEIVVIMHVYVILGILVNVVKKYVKSIVLYVVVMINVEANARFKVVLQGKHAMQVVILFLVKFVVIMNGQIQLPGDKVGVRGDYVKIALLVDRVTVQYILMVLQ